jgi:hypothetical protein
MGRPAAPSLPLQLQSIQLIADQLIYLAALQLYAGRPHQHDHGAKIADMEHAVADARLMWEVLRAHKPRNDGDVPSPQLS